MIKELVKNTGIYIIISFFSQGFIFLLWIVLAWWLVPSQIGIYALALFVIEFFSAISILGLDSTITRFYYAKESVSSILSNALTIFIFASFITSLSFFLTARLISFFIPGLSNILEENIFLFSAIIFANSVANFAFVHYAAVKKAIFYTKLQLVKVLFFCSLSLILVYLGFSILGVFYASLFSSLLIGIIFLIQERKLISHQFISQKTIKNMTSYGFPLMVYAVLGVIVTYFGRLLLDKYTNLTTLGVYNFFLMLTLQINGLWGSFNRAWAPEIFSKFLENEKRTIENVQSMVFLLSFFYLVIVAFLIIFGELFLFKLIFKEIYRSNIHLFYILLLFPLFTGIYTATYPLYYYNKTTTKIILFISLLISGVNIFLTIFMVKFFSENGAAISLFLIAIFTALIYLLSFKKMMVIPSKIINWTLLLSILMLFNVVILLKTSSSFLFFCFIILGVVLAYKIGNLFEKRYLLLNFIEGIKRKPKVQ